MSSNLVSDKLQIATNIIKESKLTDELEPDELVQIANDIKADESKYKLVAKIITYIRKRVLDKLSQYEAFKQAFPERSVVTEKSEIGNFETNRKIGDELPRKTIELKAKRLENRPIYKHILTILATSTYTMYAVDRIKVLNYLLDKIYDDNIHDRYKVEYIKTFLQETRKPEKTSELEFNVNIENNNVNIEQIDKKLEIIADKLEHTDAGSILSIINKE